MTIEERIAELVSMSPSQKKTEWHRVFKEPAPPALGLALMTRALAAKVQEDLYGGLTKAELKQIATQIRKDERVPRGVRAPIIKPGT